MDPMEQWTCSNFFAMVRGTPRKYRPELVPTDKKLQYSLPEERTHHVIKEGKKSLDIDKTARRTLSAMATHSSILAWKTPWTEEPGGLQSMVSQRVRHDWVTNYTYICTPNSQGNKGWDGTEISLPQGKRGSVDECLATSVVWDTSRETYFSVATSRVLRQNLHDWEIRK